MNKFKNFRMVGIVSVLMIIAILSACGGDSSEDGSNNNGEDMNDGVELGDKNLMIPYVSWSSSNASTHVVQALLEEVGYDVTIRQVGKGPMFASIADGTADANMSTWLPNNSKNLWGEYKEDMEKMNKTIETAPIGLVVPEYMDIDSIEDLKDNKELGEATDWTLTGIESGAGQMELTEEVLEEYGLNNWDLQASSDSAMIASLGGAIDNEEPIIVTLWEPHYAFGDWDLKMLDDPQKIYGEPDSVWTTARHGLEEDSPAAYKILKQFEWSSDHMNEVMVNIEDGMDSEDAGQQFLEDYPELVDEWLDGVK